MSKMNICKNEENWTCGNNEVVVDNPLNNQIIAQLFRMTVGIAIAENGDTMTLHVFFIFFVKRLGITNTSVYFLGV